jgi:hypothetical protein
MMESIRSKDVVTTFLSCSVRPNDWALVNSLVQRVLMPHGFRCFTIGRNVSLAEQTDDAVRRLMNSCECLIGVATKRLDATDRDFPERTLSIATPYLLQETAMAFQGELPFLILKTTGITLQGVTNRNLWIEIEPELNKSGRVKIHGSRERLLSALVDLKQKALARRAQMNTDRLKASIGWLSALVVGGYAVSEGIDTLRRPACFGDFYYKDPECKPCSYRHRCKVEKLRRQQE